jgi:hypothetical protein
VWLIQHSGCAYYRAKYPGQCEAEIVERQIRDMHRAVQCIQAKSGKLTVRAIMATLVGDKALFTPIEPEHKGAADSLAISTQLI